MELMVAEHANWFDAKQLEAPTKGKQLFLYYLIGKEVKAAR